MCQQIGKVHCRFLVIGKIKKIKTDDNRSNGARAGEIIGLIINGFISERFGYRKTMIGALMAMTGVIFVLFFAPNVQTLVAGEVLCGIPWGMFQTLTTQYASEVAPVRLRPILTTFVNMYVELHGLELANADRMQVLGNGSIYRCGRKSCLCPEARSMGLSYSIRYTVGLAYSDHGGSFPCTREPLVACS